MNGCLYVVSVLYICRWPYSELANWVYTLTAEVGSSTVDNGWMLFNPVKPGT